MAAGAPLDFSLRPFDPAAVPPELRLGGQVVRSEGHLSLLYRLEGPLDAVRWPAPAGSPARLDELWATTCFECFLAMEGARPYWEVNLSPAGHWNLYALEDYRAGLRPETACGAPTLLVAGGERIRTLRAAVPLPPALATGGPLLLGISAVLEAPGGALSYWALAHRGAAADFHRRDGFLLRP